MHITAHHPTAIPPHHRGGKPRTRSKRLVPQTASCLLAASMLVTAPAPAAAQATAPAAAEPRPASAPLALDATTLRTIRAYNKYRKKITRQRKRAKTAIAFARKQLGKPYRWGAAGPRAYDCSGLVMKAWQKAGVRLPRVTYSQYRAVRRKVGYNSLRPGDLVFFRGRAHVGMYISKNRYIHAPNSRSRIRIDRLSARRKQFAGAVRPGAPAPKKWPPSIPRLARQLEKAKAADRPKTDTPHPAPSTTLPGEGVPVATPPKPEDFPTGGLAPDFTHSTETPTFRKRWRD